jgi:cysteine desulfurase/selenocysteine lyase
MAHLTLAGILDNREVRHTLFPVTRERIFLAHAGVCPLPRLAAMAVDASANAGTTDQQEAGDFLGTLAAARRSAASLISAKPEEIALLGPTSLGLSLVANGLDWRPDDEVIYYPDDYPANVYPWLDLQRHGVRPVPLHPAVPGRLTPELILSALSPRTRLVALASCHFLTGCRLDYRTIGSELQKRGILFSIDGIQSLGSTELDAAYFDFLSADAHKWMLGPLGAGLFFVKESAMNRLRPTLLGAWNVVSPQFIAQPVIEFEPTARRYEPGSLNMVGIAGMKASLDLLQEIGIGPIQQRLLHLHRFTREKLETAGWEVCGAADRPEEQSGIVTCTKAGVDLKARFQEMQKRRISVSLRWDRQEKAWIRFSPHFYNTEDELREAVGALGA